METGKSLKRLSRGQRRAALVAVIVLACAGLWTLLPFLPALGWAIVFAVSMWPWYARLGERWPRHRGVLLPSLAVFFTLLLFVLPLIMIATALAQDTAALIQWQHQAALQGVPVPAMLPRLPYGVRVLTIVVDTRVDAPALRRIGDADAITVGALDQLPPAIRKVLS